MSTGGPSGFGQGGQPNFYPGRGYPQAGSATFRDMPDDFVGGARGPAALPSRLDPINPAGDGPAPSDPRILGFNRVGDNGNTIDGTGEQGPISYHRGAFVEDAGAPRLDFDNVFGHATIDWNRPYYPNVTGQATFHAPTQMPSWSANAAPQSDVPMSSIPFTMKKISNFTVRRPYGDTSSGNFFKNGSLALFVESIGTGMNLQGRRWLRQSKTHNPTLVNRSSYATAGSYGQTTAAIGTTPANLPASSPYGAY